MKSILITIFTIILTGLGATAQWTQLEQPTGGYCWAIERVGSDIWAAYAYGVYTSSNEGVTWTRHPAWTDPTMDIEAIGDTVVLLRQGYTPPFSFRLETITSFDGGITWNNPVVAETGNDYYTWGEREIYVTDSALILSSNSTNYYSSYDYGQSWNLITFPMMYGSITAHNNKYLVCYSNNGSQAANYFSTDGGASWNFLDSNYAAGSALVLDSTFYFSYGYQDTTIHYFIARTMDFGLSYDTLALDLLDGFGYLSYFNGKINYTSNNYPQQSVHFESSDGGDTWIPSSLSEDLIWIDDNRSVLLNNWEWLLNTGTVGLCRYNPYSGIYYPTETGIKANTITYLHANKSVLYAKIHNSNSLYLSHNAGTSWIKAPAFVQGNGDLVFKGDTVLAIAGINNLGNKLCYTYDNGLHWDSIPTVMNPAAGYIAEISGQLFASSSGAVSVSNDWGTTWNLLTDSIDTVCTASGMSVDQLIVCNNELYMLNGHQNILKYDSLSQIWRLKFCFNVPGVQYKKLFSLDNKIIFIGGSYFVVSSDSGNTWYSPAKNGYPAGIRPTSLSSINGIWFSPAGGSLYYSFDFGDNWQQLPTNPEMSVSGNCEGLVTSLNGVLYAGGNNIWRSADTLNLISGNIYFDNNNNGIKDGVENSIAYNLVYTFPNNIAFNADSLGNYVFLTAATGDTLQPALPTDYCVSTPPYYLTNGTAANQDFGLYFYPGVQDLTVDISNRCPFRPGFTTYVDVEVKNVGTVLIPSQLQVVLDSNLIYLNASVTPVLIIGNTLLFDIDTLQLLQPERISIETEILWTTPISTPIVCSASISPVIGDTLPANNYSQFNTVVVGSFDPNDKSAYYGQYFTQTQIQNGDEMIYTIRFQNTGNFQADNIHITDTLSSFFDYKSFRIISTSHDMYYAIAGDGVVSFYFDHIYLPPVTTDEPGSHGYVKFAVKFNAPLPTGTGIVNKAYIYFDFNAPIETNTVTTLIADPPLNLSTEDPVLVHHLTVYPNPVNHLLYGTFGSDATVSFRLLIVDTRGKRIRDTFYKSNCFEIDVSDLDAGLYYGRTISAAGKNQQFFRFIVIK